MLLLRIWSQRWKSWLNVNKERRWGDVGNGTVTLPEEAGQQRGGKRRSGRMSGI